MAKKTQINSIETYFEWYINELKENGFIKEIKREPFSFNISRIKFHKKYVFKETAKKSSASVEDFTLLRENNYTFDYLIIWHPKAKEYFFNLIDDSPIKIWCPFYAFIDAGGELVSFVDVKPTSAGAKFGNNSTSYTFPIIQKIIYESYGVFVNKAIPIPMVSKGEVKSGNKTSLFTTTFVPNRFRLTDSGGQARLIHYRNKTLKEYIFHREKELKKIYSILSTQSKLNL